MARQRLADYLLVGKIGAAQGLKGWVRLNSYTQPRENILEYRHFYIEDEGVDGGGVRTIEIDDSRQQGKSLLAHISGCDSREDSAYYTGRDLLVAKAELPALDEEEYYWYQLQGLRVVTMNGDDLGHVDHLLETGANDVLVVAPDQSSIDRHERLIPYVREQVVLRVDLSREVIEVDWEKDF